MTRFVAILTVLLLAGCGAGKGVKPTPNVEFLPVTKFVPIDAKLLVPCAIAEGPLSQVIDVARERKAALEACNGQLDAIRALQPAGD